MSSWRYTRCRLHPLLAVSGLLWMPVACPGESVAATAKQSLPGAGLFAHAAVLELRIDIPPAELARLRQEPRTLVSASLSDGNRAYSNVAVHLKGSVGSFRPVDDKPSLTLDFCRFQNGQAFYGLRRIHLNNSLEDPSFLNEKIGSELFQAAGVPAPRVTHAQVDLNGRRLGLYVLKEGFTEDFLACHFQQVGGDLYEPKDGHDVDQELKCLSVQAPRRGPAPLKLLAETMKEHDPARRWQRLQGVVDMDRFVAFMAMEILLGHRDGYCLARNNFRIYQDEDTDKLVFFPHGMDQLFGNPELPWQLEMAGLVARAVMDCPDGRQRYTACFQSLFTNVFQAGRLTRRVDELNHDLGPYLSSRQQADLAVQADLLKDRILQRRNNLESQLSQRAPAILVLQEGIGRLDQWDQWSMTDLSPGTEMARARAPDGVPALHITAASESAASWRAKAVLPRGLYRFEGRGRVAGVKPLPFGKHQGAGLRVAGRVRPDENALADSAWQTFRAGFEVTQDREEIELICELRAKAGEAWFDLASLQVRRD